MCHNICQMSDPKKWVLIAEGNHPLLELFEWIRLRDFQFICYLIWVDSIFPNCEIGDRMAEMEFRASNSQMQLPKYQIPLPHFNMNFNISFVQPLDGSIVSCDTCPQLQMRWPFHWRSGSSHRHQAGAWAWWWWWWGLVGLLDLQRSFKNRDTLSHF